MTTNLDLRAAVREAEEAAKNVDAEYTAHLEERRTLDAEWSAAQDAHRARMQKHYDAGDEIRQRQFEAIRAEEAARASLNIAEANALADDEYRESHQELTRELKKTLRGRYPASWAVTILKQLMLSQLAGGLCRSHIVRLEGPNDKRLTRKQVERVWAILDAKCPFRGEHEKSGEVQLGTPFPVRLTETGGVWHV